MNTIKYIETELFSAVSPRDSATQPFRVVLHKTGAGKWVTHLENVLNDAGDSKPLCDYYWGHYFEADYGAALTDYYQRCAKYKLSTNE